MFFQNLFYFTALYVQTGAKDDDMLFSSCCTVQNSDWVCYVLKAN